MARSPASHLPPQDGRPGSLTDVAITQAMVVMELLEGAFDLRMRSRDSQRRARNGLSWFFDLRFRGRAFQFLKSAADQLDGGQI